MFMIIIIMMILKGSVPASCCYNFSFDKSNKLNMFCGVGIRKNESIVSLNK